MTDLLPETRIYNRNAPCIAKMKDRKRLTCETAVKQTFHVSLDIQDTGLSFEPGDSLAVFAENAPEPTFAILAQLGIDPETTVPGQEISAYRHFSQKINLAKARSSLLTRLLLHPLRSGMHDLFSSLLLPEQKTALARFLSENDVVDILSSLLSPPENPFSFLQDFGPLLPRFYSIGSSLLEHPEEVHLLVASVSYPYKKEIRKGLASQFLCELALPEKSEIACYVQPSKHFKLPERSDANLLLIGPGTGVAPYRAFLQERIAKGASGENWLFFGNRNREKDFLYGSFWTRLEQEGKLRLSTAFSRDGEEKKYVQHLLLEHGKEIFHRIEQGAYVYVCGDAQNMAKDVEAAFITLIKQEGGLSEAEAITYHKTLKAEKRYLTDVY